MADLRVELLGPGTIPSFDPHGYIQCFHAQKTALTVLLQNEQTSELSYQGWSGKRKTIEDLLYSRLQALERSMENEIDNTRGIKTYQCMLENILRNFSLGESIAILKPVVERYLETSRSQYVANTQELHEFKLFIDEFCNATAEVELKLQDTKERLSAASSSAEFVDLSSAIWDALREIVATLGVEVDDGTMQEAWEKAAAKLLHITRYKLAGMLNRLHDPPCYRAVRETFQAYHDRLSTIHEGLLQLNAVFDSSTTGLPVQRLWENVLESLEILANCEPEYQLTEVEVDAVLAYWFETTQAVDQIMEAGNHGALFNRVTDPHDHENPDEKPTLDSQFKNMGMADDAWGYQDPSDMGIDTDHSDADTDDLDKNCAWSEDVPTPSTNRNEPVNTAELCERLSPTRAMKDSAQRILDDCKTIRQKFRQILDSPNLDKLTVDNNVWLRPAQGSDAQAGSGGRLRLKDVVERCWQEYVVLEDDCCIFMNDLKVYADSQLILLPAVLAPDPDRAILVTVYTEECRRRIKHLRKKSAGVAKQHRDIYNKCEKCLEAVQKQYHEEQDAIKKLFEKKEKLAFSHFWSEIATWDNFGVAWYFWEELILAAGGLTAAGELTGLTAAGGLTAVGGLTVAGLTAASLTAYWIWKNWNYKSTREAILNQIEKDTAVIHQLTQILPPMRVLEESLKDLRNMHVELHDNNLIYVETFVNTESLDALRVMQPTIFLKWRTIRELCDCYVEITGGTLI